MGKWPLSTNERKGNKSRALTANSLLHHFITSCNMHKGSWYSIVLLPELESQQKFPLVHAATKGCCIFQKRSNHQRGCSQHRKEEEKLNVQRRKRAKKKKSGEGEAETLTDGAARGQLVCCRHFQEAVCFCQKGLSLPVNRQPLDALF